MKQEDRGVAILILAFFAICIVGGTIIGLFKDDDEPYYPKACEREFNAQNARDCIEGLDLEP